MGNVSNLLFFKYAAFSYICAFAEIFYMVLHILTFLIFLNIFIWPMSHFNGTGCEY